MCTQAFPSLCSARVVVRPMSHRNFRGTIRDPARGPEESIEDSELGPFSALQRGCKADARKNPPFPSNSGGVTGGVLPIWHRWTP
jgi:hypothetical protein